MKFFNPLPSLCMKCFKSLAPPLVLPPPFAACTAVVATEKSGTNKYTTIITKLIKAPF